MADIPVRAGADTSGGVFQAMADTVSDPEVDVDDFEQVTLFRHRPTGLRAIVAIHSTALGPALGGTRFTDYPDEAAAVTDACRLARGMTYKHAAAGLDQGGGKAVIWGRPETLRSEALMRAYGRFVHGLGGRYLTAEDVGTTQADMDLIRTETPFVAGMSETLGGSGDPSPATAWGVLHAIRAGWASAGNRADLAGVSVAVTGVGKVGSALVGHLLDDGARVVIADIRPEAVARVLADHPESADTGRVRAVEVDQIHRQEVDVYAPCALGGALSATTIPELACAVVAGAANNQLADPDEDDDRLAERSILYVPDYVANAGGVINIAEEPAGYDRARAWARVTRIADNVTAVLTRARAEGLTPGRAADAHAEARIRAVSSTRRILT